MKTLPVYPFDSNRCIGTVVKIEPTAAYVNLPLAGRPTAIVHHGHRVPAGEVGEFVLVECDEIGIFARITEVRLPERERLGVEPSLGNRNEVHPVGQIQLLASFRLADGCVQSGIPRYPRLGSRVFSAHPDVICWIVEESSRKQSESLNCVMKMATLPHAEEASVSVSPEQMFGRHCAILGATGGGKSWTLARVLEEVSKFNSKSILLDATGEFYKLDGNMVEHVYIGGNEAMPASARPICFPFHEMLESDLFAIFRPSAQAQAPKLRAAMKSLKLVKLDNSLANDQGLLKKERMPKAPYHECYSKFAAAVDGQLATFEIRNLAAQIQLECVQPNGFNDPSTWGNYQENDYNYCLTLVYRIEQFIHAPELGCVFNTENTESFLACLERFMSDPSKRLLRVSLKHLPFSHDAREIVANSIGRCFLSLARAGRFKDQPAVVFLDEAHQFLDKYVGDESTRVHLDAFGLIAKEGRKFGLTICIATQRPRDIPDDVISQMGTLLVHRLVNDEDRRVVERACGEIDRSAAKFLPTLGPGEAVIIGVEIPVPLSIKIEIPSHKPDSRGPDYQEAWNVSAKPKPLKPDLTAAVAPVAAATNDDGDEIEDLTFLK